MNLCLLFLLSAVLGAALLCPVAASSLDLDGLSETELLEELRLLQGHLRKVQLEKSQSSCSGNGVWYPDVQACACYQCFSGPTCSQQHTPCSINDTPGNPRLFQEYWVQNPIAFETTEETYYRSPYQSEDALLWNGTLTGIQPLLQKAIFKIHAITGNAVTEGYSVVIGHGCQNLIAASMMAIAEQEGRPMNVFAQTPYYDGYTLFPDTFTGLGLGNNAPLVFNSSYNQNPADVISYITYPNNPDGSFRQPHYKAPAHFIYDCVYLWPSLVNLTEAGCPIEHPIMLFSMSKLTGHAGSRLGWALVKDADLAARMAKWISQLMIHPSIDPQYRALNLLDGLAQPGASDAYFGWVKGKMTARWSQLQDAMAGQTRFTQHSRPGTFYAWIHCENPADSNCFDTFQKAGITTWAGPLFGATSDWTRLELVVSSPVWDLLIVSLRNLFQSSA